MTTTLSPSAASQFTTDPFTFTSRAGYVGPPISVSAHDDSLSPREPSGRTDEDDSQRHGGEFVDEPDIMTSPTSPQGQIGPHQRDLDGRAGSTPSLNGINGVNEVKDGNARGYRHNYGALKLRHEEESSGSESDVEQRSEQAVPVEKARTSRGGSVISLNSSSESDQGNGPQSHHSIGSGKYPGMLSALNERERRSQRSLPATFSTSSRSSLNPTLSNPSLIAKRQRVRSTSPSLEGVPFPRTSGNTTNPSSTKSSKSSSNSGRQGLGTISTVSPLRTSFREPSGSSHPASMRLQAIMDEAGEKAADVNQRRQRALSLQQSADLSFRGSKFVGDAEAIYGPANGSGPGTGTNRRETSRRKRVGSLSTIQTSNLDRHPSRKGSIALTVKSPLTRAPSSSPNMKPGPSPKPWDIRLQKSVELDKIKQQDEDRERRKSAKRKRQKRPTQAIELGFERHLSPKDKDSMNSELDRIPATEAMLFYYQQQFDKANHRKHALSPIMDGGGPSSIGTMSPPQMSPDLPSTSGPNYFSYPEPYVAKAPPALTQKSPNSPDKDKQFVPGASSKPDRTSSGARHGSFSVHRKAGGEDGDSSSGSDDERRPRVEEWKIRRMSITSSADGDIRPVERLQEPKSPRTPISKETNESVSSPKATPSPHKHGRSLSLKNPFHSFKKKPSLSQLSKPRQSDHKQDTDADTDWKQVEADHKARVEKALYELPSHPRTAELSHNCKVYFEDYYRQIYEGIKTKRPALLDPLKVLRWKQSIAENTPSQVITHTPPEPHSTRDWSTTPDNLGSSRSSFSLQRSSAVNSWQVDPADTQAFNQFSKTHDPISSAHPEGNNLADLNASRPSSVSHSRRSSRSHEHRSLTSSLAKFIQKRAHTTDDGLSRTRSQTSQSIQSIEEGTQLHAPTEILPPPPKVDVIDFAGRPPTPPAPRHADDLQAASDVVNGEKTPTAGNSQGQSPHIRAVGPKEPPSDADIGKSSRGDHVEDVSIRQSQASSVVPSPPSRPTTEDKVYASKTSVLLDATRIAIDGQDDIGAIDQSLSSLTNAFDIISRTFQSNTGFQMSKAPPIPKFDNQSTLLGRSLSQSKGLRADHPRRGSVVFRRRMSLPSPNLPQAITEPSRAPRLVSVEGGEYQDPLLTLHAAVIDLDKKYTQALPQAQQANQRTDVLYDKLSGLSQQAKALGKTGQIRRDAIVKLFKDLRDLDNNANSFRRPVDDWLYRLGNQAVNFVLFVIRMFYQAKGLVIAIFGLVSFIIFLPFSLLRWTCLGLLKIAAGSWVIKIPLAVIIWTALLAWLGRT